MTLASVHEVEEPTEKYTYSEIQRLIGTQMNVFFTKLLKRVAAECSHRWDTPKARSCMETELKKFSPIEELYPLFPELNDLSEDEYHALTDTIAQVAKTEKKRLYDMVQSDEPMSWPL